MARVLYWNVNNFTSEKIATVTRKRLSDNRGFRADPAGTGRLTMMMSTFGDGVIPGGGYADLDFIVIVEIFSRNTGREGEAIDGNGLTGCINLLNYLNDGMMGQWALVPPVVTGQEGKKEAIAVYYRHDRWYFLGPQSWGRNYFYDLRIAMPDRVIPNGYPYRSNRRERMGAGQFAFAGPNNNGFVGPMQMMHFPGADNRKPWLTAFGGVGNPNLLVRLTAIHTSPATADQGTAALADVAEITTQAPDAPQQIDVILGDFNVENTNPANFQAGGPFGRLIGQGVNPVNPPYTPLLCPPAGLDPTYNSFYHTHGCQPHAATILDDDERPAGFYPGYRYTDESIDNAFVRYRGLLPPANHNLTILNRVTDQPYDALNPPPVPPPARGYYEMAYWMDETVDAIIGRAPNWLFNLNEVFRDWDNYGLIHSVSDHFPLLFDI